MRKQQYSELTEIKVCEGRQVLQVRYQGDFISLQVELKKA
jgi:hypothetical protein